MADGETQIVWLTESGDPLDVEAPEVRSGIHWFQAVSEAVRFCLEDGLLNESGAETVLSAYVSCDTATDDVLIPLAESWAAVNPRVFVKLALQRISALTRPRPQPLRKNEPWTESETAALARGVEKHGIGNWAVILRDPELTFASGRTNVDLKDKWHNVRKQSLCKHGRRRSHCKECGGSQICEHRRRRYECKECGGSRICEHGRVRYSCKECGGAGICEHGRVRYECKECGGAGICEHGRVRYSCKECGGAGICEHGRERYYCKECGGAGICEHGRQRQYCKDCGRSNPTCRRWTR